MLLENLAKGARAHHRSAPWLIMALLTAVVLFLAGCTSEAKGDTEPTVEASVGAPRSTPSPDESDPSTNTSNAEPSETLRSDLPRPKKNPETTTEDESEAISTARHFIDSYIYATLSGDTTDFTGAYDPGCGFCEDALTGIELRTSKGQEILNGDIQRTDGFLDSDGIVDGKTSVHFKLDQEAAGIVDHSGATVSSHSSGSFLVRVDLRFQGKVWVVSNVLGGAE